MYKSEQEVKVTYVVEGPDEEGLFLVDDMLFSDDTEDHNVRRAIHQHLKSMPVKIDGFLIGPRDEFGDVAVWAADFDVPFIVGPDLDTAIQRYGMCDSRFRRAYLALIKYFIRKEEGTL